MRFKVKYIIEGEMVVEAQNWNEAESVFDNHKYCLMQNHDKVTTCEVTNITKVSEDAD